MPGVATNTKGRSPILGKEARVGKAHRPIPLPTPPTPYFSFGDAIDTFSKRLLNSWSPRSDVGRWQKPLTTDEAAVKLQSAARGHATRRAYHDAVKAGGSSLEALPLMLEHPKLLQYRFPMWVMPIRTLLRLESMRSHEVLLAEGLIERWQPRMCTVFASQVGWLGVDAPDPIGLQLALLKRVLSGMVSGTIGDIECAVDVDGHYGKRGLRISGARLRKQLRHGRGYVWLHHFSAPQAQSDSMGRLLALASLPSYVQRSDYFLALAGHAAGSWYQADGTPMDRHAWAARGVPRLEALCNHLLPSPRPIIFAQSLTSICTLPSSGMPWSGWLVLCNAPGLGRFAAHEMDARRLGPLMRQLVHSRKQAALEQGDMHFYRLLHSLTPSLLAGTGIGEGAAFTRPRLLILDEEEREVAAAEAAAQAQASLSPANRAPQRLVDMMVQQQQLQQQLIARSNRSSPSSSPQASPQASPKTSPQASPQASPAERLPTRARHSPSASPPRSPPKSPPRSPPRSPLASAAQSPARSPPRSPARSPLASPARSPLASPARSPPASRPASPASSSSVPTGSTQTPQHMQETPPPRAHPRFSVSAAQAAALEVTLEEVVRTGKVVSFRDEVTASGGVEVAAAYRAGMAEDTEVASTEEWLAAMRFKGAAELEDATGLSPLHYAVLAGRVDIVDELIAKEASIEAVTTSSLARTLGVAVPRGVSALILGEKPRRVVQTVVTTLSLSLSLLSLSLSTPIPPHALLSLSHTTRLPHSILSLITLSPRITLSFSLSLTS